MKRRDSKTGLYISAEDAKLKDDSTWIKEKEFDKGKFLEKLFNIILLKVYPDSNSKEVIALEDLEEVFSHYNSKINMKDTFINKLNLVLKGLTYISETDSQIRPFLGGKKDLGLPFDLISSDTKTIEFDKFFDNLTQEQDWFGKEEIEIAENFKKLKKLLEDNLDELKVYKVGETQIDIYIIGVDKVGNLRGVQTKAVES